MADYYSKIPAGTAGSGTYRGLWTASTTWAVGDVVVPTVAYATAAAKGYVYVCSTPGTGGTEPTWVYTTPGTSTTTDGAAVFTCQNATTWANSTPRPDYIINNKMAAGESLFSENGSYPITADTTYTLPGTAASPCRWISTSDTANAPPTSVATGATIDGSATAGVDVTISGKGFIYGWTFKSGSGTASVRVAYADQSIIDAEACIFSAAAAGSGGEAIMLGQYLKNSILRTQGCEYKLGTVAGGYISKWGIWESVGDTFTPGGSQPTALIGNACGPTRIVGADLSAITSTLFGNGFYFPSQWNFHQCKMGSGVAVLATQTYPCQLDVYLTDCSSTDNHYELAHYNYWGNTTISTSIYLNTADGAAYNSTGTKYSWKVTGVNGTFATPYKSPWIDAYNEATGAVTPRLEICRDGSATAYNDNQVWGEWTAKTTTGYSISTSVNDKCGLVAAAAAQTPSALGASDWAGEGGSAWFGKLEPGATVTPAEIGDFAARVCVAGSITVYVNPKILGT